MPHACREEMAWRRTPPPEELPDASARGPRDRQSASESLRTVSFHYVLILAGLGAALTLMPLWAPLLLSSWMAMVLRPVHLRLVKRVGGSGAAATITLLLVVVVLAPLSILTLSLVSEASSLYERLKDSGGLRQALQTLLSDSPAGRRLDPSQVQVDVQQVLRFAQRHGGGALNAAGTLFGAATQAAIAVVVFLYGLYSFLINAPRARAWIFRHSPLEQRETDRLTLAYLETGRGLLIGVGLTAVLQGTVATVGYVIIGVPQALVLGLFTTFAAFIPTLGTGLVWLPLAIGLFIADRAGEAIAVVVLGCVASVADNFIRPMLSRHARLDLPMFVLFVAMLGGIAMFGPWGLLLGPLLVRLALEALRLGRERRELGDDGRVVSPAGDALSGQPRS